MQCNVNNVKIYIVYICIYIYHILFSMYYIYIYIHSNISFIIDTEWHVRTIRHVFTNDSILLLAAGLSGSGTQVALEDQRVDFVNEGVGQTGPPAPRFDTFDGERLPLSATVNMANWSQIITDLAPSHPMSPCLAARRLAAPYPTWRPTSCRRMCAFADGKGPQNFWLCERDQLSPVLSFLSSQKIKPGTVRILQNALALGLRGSSFQRPVKWCKMVNSFVP